MDVRDEQTKYCTRINIYEYQRQRPADPMRRNYIDTHTLPLPVAIPAEQHAVHTGAEDLGYTGHALDTLGDGWSGASNADKVVASIAAGGVAATVVSLLTGSLFKSGGMVSDASQRILGAGGALAVIAGGVAQSTYGINPRNPHTAMLFDKTQMREFQFVWRFAPRTEQQSRNIDTLAAIFRQALLPSFFSGRGAANAPGGGQIPGGIPGATGGRFALQYPQLFTVEFEGLSHLNTYPKVDYAFLQNFAVSTADRNGNVFFRNGYPAFVEFHMNFQEISMKTREFYESGGRGLPDTAPRGRGV